MFIAQATSDPVSQAWLEVLAHLHPLVLHFPLALVIVGAVAMLWNWFRGEEGVGDFAYHCIWIAAVLAVVASASGWFLAEGETGERDLEWHRWFAIGSTCALFVLAIIASLSRNDDRPGVLAATRLLTLVTAGGMAFTGHLGGNMKWGDDFVTEPMGVAIKASWARIRELNERQQGVEAPATKDDKKSDEKKVETAPAAIDDKTSGEAKPADAPHVSMGAVSGDAIDAGDPPTPPPAPPADKPSTDKPAGDKPSTTTVPPTVPPKKPVSYKDDLLPLMKARCYECHSGEKPKDGIGFDHMAELIKTSGKRAVVMKGDPAKSNMFATVMKPDGNKKRMPPPKKGDRLTPEEAGIIEAWIKEGAKLDN
jgi:uncharacterized membrane protein